MTHSCIQFLRALIRESVGYEAYEQAMIKLRDRFNFVFNPIEEDSDEDDKTAKSGTLENILSR